MLTTASRPFLLLTPTHQQASWGCTRRRQKTQPRPQLTKETSQIIWHHVQHIKLRGKGRRGDAGRDDFSPSQATAICGAAQLSCRWLETCLLMKSGELIPSLTIPVCIPFTLPIELPLSQPTSFPTFPILSPTPPRRSKWGLYGAYVLAAVKHKTRICWWAESNC